MHSVWSSTWISNWPLVPPAVQTAQLGAQCLNLDCCQPNVDTLRTGKAFVCTKSWVQRSEKHSTSRSELNFSCSLGTPSYSISILIHTNFRIILRLFISWTPVSLWCTNQNVTTCVFIKGQYLLCKNRTLFFSPRGARTKLNVLAALIWEFAPRSWCIFLGEPLSCLVPKILITVIFRLEPLRLDRRTIEKCC